MPRRPGPRCALRGGNHQPRLTCQASAEPAHALSSFVVRPGNDTTLTRAPTSPCTQGERRPQGRSWTGAPGAIRPRVRCGNELLRTAGPPARPCLARRGHQPAALAGATPERPSRHRARGAGHRPHRRDRHCVRRHPRLSHRVRLHPLLTPAQRLLPGGAAVPLPAGPRPFGGDPFPDGFLRFGVQFADGRKATNLDRPAYDAEQEPDRPVLNQHGGGGGGSAWDLEHWVWPLPPAGPFAFVCEWPGRDIVESRAEIDAGLILEAAGRAVTFWSDD